MRHRNYTLKLNRTPAHLRAMLANAACSLFTLERITTTEGRAKAVCRFAEKMITLAKRGDLHSRRTAMSRLHDARAVARLFKELGPRYAQRKGGYTRVVKGVFRRGDGAPMAVCELMDTTVPVRVRKLKKDEGAKKAKS
ncbi:MAG: 50S ribosomal protein L17 [Candidatus Aureabacteria bacterium]|nr:50S ribosomal protein L17 [Candidatus Auribacterota bacterium]